MKSQASRRDLLCAGTHAALTASVVGLSSSSVVAAEQKPAAASSNLWAGYPRIDQKLVSEIVGASHFNEPRVKELVKTYPELVHACWDWGFGDWETPLGAASHVGHRGIAEFLLAHGARIDIFAAAMLGFTDVVKAFVTAQPVYIARSVRTALPCWHMPRQETSRQRIQWLILKGLAMPTRALRPRRLLMSVRRCTWVSSRANSLMSNYYAS